MNAKQWNMAMFSALVALVVIAVPLFSTAELFDGGFMPDFDFEISPVIDDSGFTNDDTIGFVNDVNGGFTPGQDVDVSGTVGDIGGWDPLDDDLGPFDPIPGNPPGDDTVRPPETNWPPVVPPVVTSVTPSTEPSSESEETLHIFIHNIFVNNPYDEQPGNQVPLMITFQNTGTKKLENTKVIVMIPDLSARATVGPFDLCAGEKITSTVFIDLPEDAELGVYPVRLQVYNENAQRVVHREIEVIDYS